MPKTTTPNPQKRTPRRRTSDEMKKALAVVQQKREHLLINHDDEHDLVLADAVHELLETRLIMMRLMQEIGAAFNEATTSIKNMSIS